MRRSLTGRARRTPRGRVVHVSNLASVGSIRRKNGRARAEGRVRGVPHSRVGIFEGTNWETHRARAPPEAGSRPAEEGGEGTLVNTNGSRVTRGKPSAAVRASAAVVRSRGTHRHRPRLFVARGLFEVRVRVPGRHLRDHAPSPGGSFRWFRRHGRARTWVRVVRRGLLSTFEKFRLRVRRVAVGSARERI